jgi:hypothetical protein
MWTGAMPDTDEQEQQDVQPTESIHEALETGTNVVSVVEVAAEDDVDEAEAPISALAIRHVIERQLVASQSLGEQLVEVATAVSAAVVHAPAIVVDEIRGGATLPAAFANTGNALLDAVNTAGGRVRTAVGSYVGARATLPNAVVVGAADVAESVVRAQGTVAATAVSGAFAVATIAARGGDVWEAFGDERREVRAQAVVAREEIAQSVRQAREHIESARDIG